MLARRFSERAITSSEPPIETYVTTGVRLPTDVLAILRLAAVHRAEVDGTRVSVSGLLADLVRANANVLGRRP